ncbi:hypothetical protein PPERSA_00961 [Pseudocohnilembus persalinus]|uniref:Transmembrane protein n=1 Tax=Pseudocohnilembus persalinus TaxID=266149 RepID=A0A0V0R8H0_PSEPJ|nr:hypothetical protein PPERSA_00961 [Pseudocohnilembus persalinus]|eukprot:KRX10791.1 hypothetical protein PPERSA_00961 [Pseudocohnilembus persalinus]
MDTYCQCPKTIITNYLYCYSYFRQMTMLNCYFPLIQQSYQNCYYTQLHFFLVINTITKDKLNSNIISARTIIKVNEQITTINFFFLLLPILFTFFPRLLFLFKFCTIRSSSPNDFFPYDVLNLLTPKKTHQDKLHIHEVQFYAKFLNGFINCTYLCIFFHIVDKKLFSCFFNL